MVARGRSISRRVALAAAVLGLAAQVACDTTENYMHRLHGPVDIAWLEPGGVFEVPVAYTTNLRSGQIAKLDLKRIDLLVEESPASWISSPYLACGRERLLDQIAVTTDGATRVDVFVSDDRFGQILRVPHVIPDGEGGYDFPTVRWTEPQAAGPDGEVLADGPVIEDLQPRIGYATTEEWTLTYSGHSWVVSGTASGLQLREALPGIAYETDDEELSFTVRHGGAEVEQGTTIRFSTDTGIVAFDVPGIVSDMMALDEETVVATVLGLDGDGALWIYRGDDDTAWLDLPAGTVPENLAPHRDGSSLWIADSSDASRVLLLTLDVDDPDASTVEELPVSEPAFDVAHGRDPDHDWLFVAAAYGETVEIIDLDTGEPVDVNTWTPEVDPVFIGSLVTGLDATEGTLTFRSSTEAGRPEEGYGVVATTYAGRMHVIEADSGCQALESSFGPYLDVLNTGATVSYVDVGPENDTTLLEDPISAQQIAINPCGGIARDQVWTLRYHEDTLDWEVEGDVSGIQEGRARENERYVSDDGEISFVIASGARASSEGDWITFSVNDGISPIGVLELPSSPLVYTDVYDDREGSWWEHKERQVALVPNAGNDVVMWIHIEGYGGGGLKYFR